MPTVREPMYYTVDCHDTLTRAVHLFGPIRRCKDRSLNQALSQGRNCLGCIAQANKKSPDNAGLK